MPFYVRETQTVDNKSSTREKKRPGVRERNIDSRHTYMFTLYLYGWVCVCLCVCVCIQHNETESKFLQIFQFSRGNGTYQRNVAFYFFFFFFFFVVDREECHIRREQFMFAYSPIIVRRRDASRRTCKKC